MDTDIRELLHDCLSQFEARNNACTFTHSFELRNRLRTTLELPLEVLKTVPEMAFCSDCGGYVDAYQSGNYPPPVSLTNSLKAGFSSLFHEFKAGFSSFLHELPLRPFHAHQVYSTLTGIYSHMGTMDKYLKPYCDLFTFVKYYQC